MSLWGTLTGGGSALRKAKGRGEQAPSAINYDPFVNALNQSDYNSKLHPGTYTQTFDSLDWWARQPIVQLPPRIQWTTLAEFCRPVQTDWTQGFRVGLVDEKKTMSKGAEKVAREITEVLMRAGGKYQWPPTGSSGGNMEAAMGMFLRQSLIYDQGIFEVLYSRGNKPWGWLPQDARMFRLARPSSAEQDKGQVYPDESRCFVQQDETGRNVRAFGEDEICWFIRNPRVDIRWRGYGYPEYDELQSAIDSCFRTFTYNDANFRNGIHAHTIILMRTGMDSTQFDAMKRGMLTMLTQPRNAHRAMVMQLKPQAPGQAEAGREDVDIKQIGQSNSEMEYQKWLDLTVQLLCAGYRMDPIDLNILFGNQGQSNSMGTANASDRSAMSRGRWLPRLLRQTECAMNGAIVSRYDPDFVMRWTGFGAPSNSERLEMDIKATKTFMTINECRARYDLKPLEFQVADEVPLDPALINAYLQTASQGDQFDDQDGADAGPLDAEMKGTNWNDVDEWTGKLAKALAPRMKRKDRGAGCQTWVAEVV